MISGVMASGLADIEVDWTAIILAIIAGIGSTTAAWMSLKTNKKVSTSNGKTIGQYVESTHNDLTPALTALAEALKEARIVREHEVSEAVLAAEERKASSASLEAARQRVADEIARLNDILKHLTPILLKEGGKHDEPSGGTDEGALPGEQGL